jgi:hypothetical protein
LKKFSMQNTPAFFRKSGGQYYKTQRIRNVRTL